MVSGERSMVSGEHSVNAEWEMASGEWIVQLTYVKLCVLYAYVVK